jgi:hypothetical protein
MVRKIDGLELWLKKDGGESVAEWKLDGRGCPARFRPERFPFAESEAYDRRRGAKECEAALRSLGRALGEALLPADVEAALAKGPREMYAGGDPKLLELPLEALATRAGRHLGLDGHRNLPRRARR